MLYFGKELRSFHIGNIGSEGQRASKLLAVKVRVFKNKSAASAIPAKLCASKFGPGSSSPRVKTFSIFDGQQLCSPLTNRPHISFIVVSKAFLKFVKSSRGWQHLKGGFALLK